MSQSEEWLIMPILAITFHIADINISLILGYTYLHWNKYLNALHDIPDSSAGSGSGYPARSSDDED